MAEFDMGGVTISLPDGATDEQRRAAIAKFRQSEAFEKIIDKSRGAPAKVRMIVGGAPEKDRLANLKRFYPDAVPYGDNFVFTDPDTGRPTLYNPPGFDVLGDTASVAREISQATGAAMGATAGSAVPGGGTVVGAGLGTAAGGTLFDISMNLLEGRVDTRNLQEATTDVALDFAAGAAGQRLGEVLPAYAKKVMGTSAKAARNLAQSFKNLGVKPPAGAVTGSRAVGSVEKMLESTPTSAAVMQKQAERVLEETAKAADDIARQFGTPQTRTGAGETIKQASIKAAERFGFKQEGAYTKAFDLIGPDTPVSVKSVSTLREQLAAELAKAPKSLKSALSAAIKKADDIIADAGEDGVSFSALRQIRTNLGKDLDAPVLVGGTGARNAALKRVYGALTEDMSSAAKATSKEAGKLVEKADRFTRLFMNTSAKTLEKIAKLEGDEKAFDFVLRAGKDSAQQLARLRRAFTPEEWDTVASSVLSKMGQAKAGAQNAAGDAFSVNTFLTNWNKMTPEGRKILFGGSRYKDVAPLLDDLVKVTGSLKEMEKLTNTSNTGRNMIAWMTMQSLLGGLGGVAVGGDTETAAMGALTTIIAPRVAAKLITSPSFVKWIMTPVTNPNGLSAHLGRLLAIGKAEPEIKEEIQQYLDALRPANG